MDVAESKDLTAVNSGEIEDPSAFDDSFCRSRQARRRRLLPP
jgi:hypothetical protein